MPARPVGWSNSFEEGMRAETVGDLERAVALFSAAATASDPAIAAEALTRLADVRRSRAEWEPALTVARRGREIARAAGRYFAESYPQFQHAGYRRGEATALINYGRVTFDRCNPQLAEDLLCQALTAAREIEHAELTALATLNLAETRARLGDTAQAEDLASEALGIFSGCCNRWREIECLRLIGAIHEQRGDAENATRCFERGLRLAREIGATVEIRSLDDWLCRVSGKKRG